MGAGEKKKTAFNAESEWLCKKEKFPVRASKNLILLKVGLESELIRPAHWKKKKLVQGLISVTDFPDGNDAGPKLSNRLDKLID